MFNGGICMNINDEVKIIERLNDNVNFSTLTAGKQYKVRKTYGCTYEIEDDLNCIMWVSKKLFRVIE